nr:phospholipase D family protein [uncultured Draconibacterium sp.]
MAKFLNTEKIIQWIKEIIASAEDELIIIVPYIKTSSRIYDSLYQANQKGVDITLIYRENKLSSSEKQKLLSLQNLNLLHHPNIHAKCYYNGDLLLICSMNLYDYSEKNNREMGVLLHLVDIQSDENPYSSYFNDQQIEFLNAKKEIREIINGSTIDRINSSKHNGSFELDNIKSEEELAQERCNNRNRFFLNKKFEPLKQRDDLWYECCSNYYDHVDVTFEGHRVGFQFKHPDINLEELYAKWMKSYKEYEIKDFKYYWNYFESPLYLYSDKRYNWDYLRNRSEEEYQMKVKGAIEYIIKKYRSVSGK